MKKSTLIVALILSVFLGLFLVQKINLPAADIGRHIKNGEVLLHAKEYAVSRSALLHTNFFSFTFPDFPFINHHWGYGIIAYLTYSMFGWAGLSLSYIFTLILTFLILFFLISRKTPLYASLPLSIFLIPLIAERSEIRPEGLSYLFIAIFLYILTKYNENTLKKKYIYILPVLCVFWINIHIYAILGPLLVGTFLCESLWRKDWEKVKTFLLIIVLCGIGLLLSPYGLSGALYPFMIFENYGYMVAENQSIPFLQNLNFINPNFLWWKLSALVALVLSIVVSIQTGFRRFPIALGITTLAFGGLSFFGIRHLTLFGLVLLPFLGTLVGQLSGENETSHIKDTSTAWAWSVIISLFLLLCIFVRFDDRLPGSPRWGFGLYPRNADSALFVQKNNINGPFFSNYDIGGLLIFTLFTPERKEKVFVDNRPEVYPESFFFDTYKPMQENHAVWEEKSKEYNFNAVWFYRLDSTPWAQQFLISLIKNPGWAPVYVDDFTIIFLKRVEKNNQLIKQYELPQSMFSVQ
ncbi:MAG: hypothetical protein RL292_269 [Candidatus Parcubacteria bacterium]|jgi:hypothetical protein